MESPNLFADIVLPLALPRLFTYRIPFILQSQVRELQHVIVPLGKQKRYTGIIWKIHNNPPQNYEARYLDQILDGTPLFDDTQRKFWEWIASYYFCSLGEVMQAALPSGLKLSSESRFRKAIGASDIELNDREYLILEALEKQPELKLKDVESIIGIKTVYPLLKQMIEKRLIVSTEEIEEKFRPRTEIWINLADSYRNEESMNQLIHQLNRAPRQLELLLAYLSFHGNHDLFNARAVKRNELVKKAGGQQNNALTQILKKGIFITEERTVSRLGGDDETDKPEIILSTAQQEALNQIHEHLSVSKPVLLHGLTGSGKTEIYTKLIEEQLNNGKQVLYLLPEIALTAQIINRLRRLFGRKVQVYHSRFSENERVEVWNAVARNDRSEGSLILGARSSLFLPFKNLGLIVIDEEHEPSFKQNEPAPRYHARDAAIYLAQLAKADVVLGSATPSLESYHNALIGKYALVKLEERFGGATLPQITLVDLKRENMKRQMHGVFSSSLIKTMEKIIAMKGQIILFQNRRGFAPMLKCQGCQWTPTCVQCDISLTYHKAIHQLRCHYCGYSTNVPSTCPQCGSSDIKMLGFGTEKIEEELAVVFPETSVQRMDLDTTRSKFAYHRIIDDFEQQRVQVLVGTQMVSKGLDFSNVKLVGVLSADAMLNYPDFRAHERSYQLLSQVAGRSGRSSEQGMVMIQTWNPDHPVLKLVQTQQYEIFFNNEIQERKQYLYPPFSKLIQITVKHEKADVLDDAADLLAKQLIQSFGNRILGPEYPTIIRVRNYFQKRILIKLEPKASTQKAKIRLAEILSTFYQNLPLKNVQIVTDVDPIG